MAAAATAEATGPTVTLIAELAAGTLPPQGFVALSSKDAAGVPHRYPVHVATFRKYSKFATNVLLDDEAEPQDIEVTSDSGQPANLQLFCTWLQRRETVKASRIRVPTPDLPIPQKLYRDEWDYAFFNEKVCPAVIPSEKALLRMPSDLTNAPQCMSVALLAIYFEAEELTKACVTWITFFMRRRIQETRDPEFVAQSWLKRDTPFSDEEKTRAQKFWDEATADVELPSDSEFAEDDDDLPPIPSA